METDNYHKQYINLPQIHLRSENSSHEPESFGGSSGDGNNPCLDKADVENAQQSITKEASELESGSCTPCSNGLEAIIQPGAPWAADSGSGFSDSVNVPQALPFADSLVPKPSSLLSSLTTTYATSFSTFNQPFLAYSEDSPLKSTSPYAASSPSSPFRGHSVLTSTEVSSSSHQAEGHHAFRALPIPIRQAKPTALPIPALPRPYLCSSCPRTFPNEHDARYARVP